MNGWDSRFNTHWDKILFSDFHKDTDANIAIIFNSVCVSKSRVYPFSSVYLLTYLHTKESMFC